MSLTTFGSELGEARGYGANSSFLHLAKAFNISNADKITRENTLRKFRELDVDNSGQIDCAELVEWGVNNKIFGPDVDNETLAKIVKGIYVDSGASAEGMDPDKFYTFVKGIQSQAKQLSLAAKHHCMTIPQ